MKIVIPIDREENEPRVVYRGGVWNDYPYYVQASFRNYVSPAYRNYFFGFRLVKSQK
jgi:formylglycine-generating enzyme required for sulfatase activity